MILDNIIALRIIYLLVTPFDKQEAYKLKIIDKDGNALLPLSKMNDEQQANYTMLHRLVFRIKKLLAKVPGGKTQFASVATAYLLVKECMQSNSEPEDLEQIFESRNTLAESNKEYDFERLIKQIDELFALLNEDPVTVTSGMAKSESPLKKKSTPVVRIPSDKFKLTKAELIKEFAHLFEENAVVCFGEGFTDNWKVVSKGD